MRIVLISLLVACGTQEPTPTPPSTTTDAPPAAPAVAPEAPADVTAPVGAGTPAEIAAVAPTTAATPTTPAAAAPAATPATTPKPASVAATPVTPPPAAATSAAPPPPAAAATTAATPAAPPPRGPTTYTLSSSSWLYVVLKYDRNTLIKGHDHVIKATKFDGTVTWSPTDPSACKVDIRVPVSGLSVDPKGARARAGLDGDTNPDDLPKIKENMLTKGQLDASNNPEITYKATRCDGTSGKVKVTGDLRIRGVSKSVTITLNVAEDGSKFSASGSTGISHTMFGFQPFVAALGALKNDDPLKLVLDVSGSAN